jgi:hypothetical protein
MLWLHQAHEAFFFLKETDLDHYAKLIVTPLFRELTGEEM